MNAEMTMQQALERIEKLNSELLYHSIMAGIVFLVLCGVIVWLSHRNTNLINYCRLIERNYLEANQRCRQLEEDKTALQGLIATSCIAPPKKKSTLGMDAESEIIDDAIGPYGPGGGGLGF